METATTLGTGEVLKDEAMVFPSMTITETDGRTDIWVLLYYRNSYGNVKLLHLTTLGTGEVLKDVALIFPFMTIKETDRRTYGCDLII